MRLRPRPSAGCSRASPLKRKGARATPRTLRDAARESRPACRSVYFFLLGVVAVAFFLLEPFFLLDFFLCLASGLGFRRLKPE